MTKETLMTVYYVTVNRPGYSPEGEPIGCETLADARDVMNSELQVTADSTEPATGKRDALCAALDDVDTLQPGHSITFAGYVHTITESADAF